MQKENAKKNGKKSYKAPKLTKFGSVEKLTKGSGAGPLDCGFVSA